jgi:hypothetical protein
MKQGDSSSPLYINAASEHIRKVQENREELEFNRTHQFQVYADDANI